MGGRDHSEECEVCGDERGGINDSPCSCDAAAKISQETVDELVAASRDEEGPWTKRVRLLEAEVARLTAENWQIRCDAALDRGRAEGMKMVLAIMNPTPEPR